MAKKKKDPSNADQIEIQKSIQKEKKPRAPKKPRQKKQQSEPEIVIVQPEIQQVQPKPQPKKKVQRKKKTNQKKEQEQEPPQQQMQSKSLLDQSILNMSQIPKVQSNQTNINQSRLNIQEPKGLQNRMKTTTSNDQMNQSFQDLSQSFINRNTSKQVNQRNTELDNSLYIKNKQRRKKKPKMKFSQYILMYTHIPTYLNLRQLEEKVFGKALAQYKKQAQRVKTYFLQKKKQKLKKFTEIKMKAQKEMLPQVAVEPWVLKINFEQSLKQAKQQLNSVQYKKLQFFRLSDFEIRHNIGLLNKNKQVKQVYQVQQAKNAKKVQKVRKLKEIKIKNPYLPPRNQPKMKELLKIYPEDMDCQFLDESIEIARTKILRYRFFRYRQIHPVRVKTDEYVLIGDIIQIAKQKREFGKYQKKPKVFLKIQRQYIEKDRMSDTYLLDRKSSIMKIVQEKIAQYQLDEEKSKQLKQLFDIKKIQLTNRKSALIVQEKQSVIQEVEVQIEQQDKVNNKKKQITKDSNQEYDQKLINDQKNNTNKKGNLNEKDVKNERNERDERNERNERIDKDQQNEQLFKIQQNDKKDKNEIRGNGNEQQNQKNYKIEFKDIYQRNEIKEIKEIQEIKEVKEKREKNVKTKERKQQQPIIQINNQIITQTPQQEQSNIPLFNFLPEVQGEYRPNQRNQGNQKQRIIQNKTDNVSSSVRKQRNTQSFDNCGSDRQKNIKENQSVEKIASGIIKTNPFLAKCEAISNDKKKQGIIMDVMSGTNYKLESNRRKQSESKKNQKQRTKSEERMENKRQINLSSDSDELQKGKKQKNISLWIKDPKYKNQQTQGQTQNYDQESDQEYEQNQRQQQYQSNPKNQSNKDEQNQNQPSANNQVKQLKDYLNVRNSGSWINESKISEISDRKSLFKVLNSDQYNWVIFSSNSIKIGSPFVIKDVSFVDNWKILNIIAPQECFMKYEYFIISDNFKVFLIEEQDILSYNVFDYIRLGQDGKAIKEVKNLLMNIIKLLSFQHKGQTCLIAYYQTQLFEVMIKDRVFEIFPELQKKYNFMMFRDNVGLQRIMLKYLIKFEKITPDFRVCAHDKEFKNKIQFELGELKQYQTKHELYKKMLACYQ